MKNRDKQIYIDKQCHIAIYLSDDENICYSYDLNSDGSLDKESEGILVELDSEILKRVNQYLKIDIREYGVQGVIDEVVCKNDV